MVDLTLEEKKFLKGLRKLASATEDDVKNIYLLYRKLIDDPKVVDEYLNCNCPSLVRDMGFDLVLWTLANKKELK